MRPLLLLLLTGAVLSASPGVLGAESATAKPPVPFQDRTAELGLKLGTDAACWVDLDKDGWADLCASGVAWKNHRGTNFTRVADVGLVVAADFDNDGQFDLFAGNFAHQDSRGDQPKSRFLRNLGPSESYHFQDLGPCGVFYQESYASPAAGDYDNDGHLDLFFTTVYGVASFNRPNFPVLYHNDGKFIFSDGTKAAGLAGLPPTYQAAWADFDHDGRLDLVSGGKLFANRGRGGHWLEVRLTGDGRRVNRSAIGAQVRIKLGRETLTRQVEAGTGQGNQNDLTLHFGLGDHHGPVDLEISWPDRTLRRVRGVRPDRLVEVELEQQASAPR